MRVGGAVGSYSRERGRREARGRRGGRRTGRGRDAGRPGHGLDGRLPAAGAGTAWARPALRRDLGGDGGEGARARPGRRALCRPRCAPEAGPCDRRGGSGGRGRLAREGGRSRPHPREGGRRGGGPVRRRRLLGQDRRSTLAAGAARAPRVRARGHAAPARRRGAPERPPEPRRRCDRRLHRGTSTTPRSSPRGSRRPSASSSTGSSRRRWSPTSSSRAASRSSGARFPQDRRSASADSPVATIPKAAASRPVAVPTWRTCSARPEIR